MKTFLDKNRAIWENGKFENWRDFRPPWRPSDEDINNYKQGMGVLSRKNKILILGATPELRELAARTGVRVWVADYSLNMIRQMARISEAINLKKENLIISDWRGINFKKYKFSVILGDLILRLIPPADQRNFLKNLRFSLEEGGFFITRIHFINPAFGKKSARRIIDETPPAYRGRLDESYFSNLLVSRLIDKFSFDGRKNIRQRSIAAIKDYFRKTTPAFKKSVLQLALNRLNPPGAAFYPQTKNEIDVLLKNYFFIDKKFIARDYDDVDFFPIYRLKPKTY